MNAKFICDCFGAESKGNILAQGLEVALTSGYLFCEVS